MDKPPDVRVEKGVGIGVVKEGGTVNVTQNFGAAPVTPTRTIPPAVTDFVGREQEIADLTAVLRGAGRVSLNAVQGMGGVGKSELAKRVAHELCQDFPVRLWVDLQGTADNPPDAYAALRGIVGALKGPEQVRLIEDKQLPAHYLDALTGQRALLVLDNARDETQVKPLLPPDGCALLVTSRRKLSLAGVQRVALDELPPDKARELLLSIAPHVAESVADQICCLCGYLPLAVRTAGSYLEIYDDEDPTQYAANLAQERQRILTQRPTDPTEPSVEASFNLSYARLDEAVQAVFRRLAVFPATFDVAAAQVVGADTGGNGLRELRRHSLVNYHADKQRYRLHDLMRVFAQARLSADERAAAGRHAEHYEQVLRQACDYFLAGHDSVLRGLQLYDAEAANIAAGQAWAAEHWETDTRAAQLGIAYPDAGAYVLDLRLTPRARIGWLETQLAAARLLRHKEAVGTALGNLGLAYKDLGEVSRAIEFYNQQLVIAREIGNRQSEGNALGNLGVAYLALGEVGRTIEFFEQSLEVKKEIGDKDGIGNTLGNLGLAYKDLGEVRRAIEFFEQYWDIARERGNRRGEGIALGNLGLACVALGEVSRAVEFFEQHQGIACEIGDRQGEGIALANMGVAYKNLGEKARGVRLVEDALRIYEAIESPEAARVRAMLAEWQNEA